MKQLIEFIDAKTGGKLSKLMNSAGNELGVLINERFINIPPQVSVPLLDNLRLVPLFKKHLRSKVYIIF